MYTEEMLSRAEELQEELHEYVEHVGTLKPDATYQDIANTWFFLKLAELEIKLINTKYNLS